MTRARATALARGGRLLPHLAGLLASRAEAEEPRPPTGEELYVRHCASCHGATGKGDGPVAPSLTRPTPDLTVLAREGRFDEANLMAIIDGISAALHLAERGHDVVLLEAARIGAGASGRNGGQVVSGHRLTAAALEKSFGVERARLLWQLAEEAKATVRERIARHAIACDLKPGALIAAHKPRHARRLERTAEHLAEAYDYPHARYVGRAELREMLASAREPSGKAAPAPPTPRRGKTVRA